MGKKVEGIIKLQIPAGQANPSPPVGPALGARGVNIMEFCKAFNAATQEKAGLIIPVEISVFQDKSFTFIMKSPPAAVLLKKAAKIAKGSGVPNRVKVAKVTKDQVREIAETKMEDLNANDMEQAMRIIAGTARSMGIEVVNMAKHGKQYRKAAEGIDKSTPQELGAAVAYLKENSFAKFDETVELAFRLGVNPSKSDQMVRGTVALPHGTGKTVRVVVFAAGAAADAAREAGADEVGMDDLVEKVAGGWSDFDIAIATTEAMREVRKLGKVLGPRGLMPNPKTGTVTEDTATAVQQFKAGRVEFKMDRNGNVAVPCGKISFDTDKLVENINTVVEAIIGAKPSSAKGTYIKRISVSSTMGPGLTVGIKAAAAA